MNVALNYKWEWTTSEKHGIVRLSTLENTGNQPVRVRLLDGLNRLLPAGVDQMLFQNYSYLAQGYMRHERLSDHPMGIYTLNAPISDRAEPSEQLRVSYAACLGETPKTLLLSARQIEAFRQGRAIENEHEIRGEFGAFLAEFEFELAPGEKKEWIFVSDTHLDHSAIIERKNALEIKTHSYKKYSPAWLTNSKDLSYESLRQMVFSSRRIKQHAFTTLQMCSITACVVAPSQMGINFPPVISKFSCKKITQI